MTRESFSKSEPKAIDQVEFKRLLQLVVDDIAAAVTSPQDRAISPTSSSFEIFDLAKKFEMNRDGIPAETVLRDAAQILANCSVNYGHPSFVAYINAPSLPITPIAEFLSTAYNQNVAGWTLAPGALAIEANVIDWLGDYINYPTKQGAITTGGTEGNLMGLLAARRHALGPDLRAKGMNSSQVRIYATKRTHAWLFKACDIMGMGFESIRWVSTDSQERMNPEELSSLIREDQANHLIPIAAIATCGAVETGAVDPIAAVAKICQAQNVWLHVDGAYGALAALADKAIVPADLFHLAQADSIALDPHKWMYLPFDMGCVLTKKVEGLYDAVGYTPEYYSNSRVDQPTPHRPFEVTVQNSRPFRALKAWCAMRWLGKNGYAEKISKDIHNARYMFEQAQNSRDLLAISTNLGIVNVRHREIARRPDADRLHLLLLEKLRVDNHAFLSHSYLQDGLAMRGCFIDFRTEYQDIDRLLARIAETGNQIISTSI